MSQISSTLESQGVSIKIQIPGPRISENGAQIYVYLQSITRWILLLLKFEKVNTFVIRFFVCLFVFF